MWAMGSEFASGEKQTLSMDCRTLFSMSGPSGHITQKWRRYYVKTTSLWRYYVTMTSFWRNNGVIITSCVQGGIVMGLLCLHLWFIYVLGIFCRRHNNVSHCYQFVTNGTCCPATIAKVTMLTSILSCNEVSITHLKIRHMQMNSL